MMSAITTFKTRSKTMMSAITTFEPKNLTEADIRRLSADAPAALTPFHNMSERYAQASTVEIVDALVGEGFQLVKAQQPRVTRRGRDPRFNIHRVEVRHSEATARNGLQPSIHLLNSHNGRSKLRVFGGLFRLVCSNGLIVGDKVLEVSIVHREFAINDFMEKIFELQDLVMKRTVVAEKWSSIVLGEKQIFEFADKALDLRFSRSANFERDTILEAHRSEDEGNDLWTVYNRIQENTVERPIQGFNAIGRRVSSRPLTSIGANQEYNRALWQLAETYAEAA